MNFEVDNINIKNIDQHKMICMDCIENSEIPEVAEETTERIEEKIKNLDEEIKSLQEKLHNKRQIVKYIETRYQQYDDNKFSIIIDGSAGMPMPEVLGALTLLKNRIERKITTMLHSYELHAKFEKMLCIKNEQ